MYTKPLTGAERVYTVESPSTFSGPSSKGPGRIVTLQAAISAESEGMEPPASLLIRQCSNDRQASRDFLLLGWVEERMVMCFDKVDVWWMFLLSNLVTGIGAGLSLMGMAFLWEWLDRRQRGNNGR